ncbi:site-specific DNA-methyltransferase [Methanocella arvoryzae]|uniref:Type III restriction-modification system, methylation subunit n=1 Tax=Methanocella arvoryzae (strain DSM 22066 / NBRC 105507 / MRE50) TaxID=351160 RepID=Q0W920_METAR|nr:site-specific DNA-methyltransferase [Methanocella arvoryzae]CAJ35106.1 putative type III restriction-modification system, methylation subunit [Methanocella arvoryzae MRE50]
MPAVPSEKKDIEQYQHKGKSRCNNPPVGLVDPETDPDAGVKTYQYDPHLDPQLVWAGKAEHTSFHVPTVSLHVHERIDPRTIIDAVRKKSTSLKQVSLFDFERDEPIREAIEFYKHRHNWSNRLIAGDSLLVMNSLLEKEGMAGKVQMIYFDPPYGIKYGSNFQPFVNKRDVKDGKDEDLTSEPEMVKAFRDTWELGIHSYLTYLRDRLLLAKELLSDSGSIFVQISDENLHHVREILDEIFGYNNFINIITFQKTGGISSNLLGCTIDFILWYAKDIKNVKFRRLYLERSIGDTSLDRYDKVMLKDGTYRGLTPEELLTGKIPAGARRYQLAPLYSEGSTKKENNEFEFKGIIYKPRKDTHWKTTIEGLKNLGLKNRIEVMGSVIRYRRFLDDFPVIPLTDRWESTQIGTLRLYVVQTSHKVIERCLLMATDPGDIVLDPTCGSGTTAYVAEQWGRRWITCDTSRVAITLAKQRLMTAIFDYYELAYPEEGVGSGFRYKTVPHITLKSIANNEPPAQETLYDQPLVDKSKLRVTGPFTVEAVPAPTVQPVSEFEQPSASDDSIARSGESLRQGEWRSELLKTGIRGRAGQKIEFSRVEPLAGTRWLHADAETKESSPQRVVVSFGPEHAPLEQRQVSLAIEEAQKLVPKPRIVVFAAFQFDPEASKDIDETKWPGVTLLKAQMNADLLTSDLKKKKATNESFWMVGQPDVTIERIMDGEDKGKYVIEVHGFDYYDTRTQLVESGGVEKIAMWMLDTDYDGRSIMPRQVFFPMAGEKDGWAKLARNLKAEIDEDRIEAFRGTKSLPFAKGANGRIAVKIIDDRGIESLRIINVE